MSYYTGKRAFVPGGSEGIGLAVAQELQRRGAQVAVAGRSPDKLKAAQTRAPGVSIHPLDLTDAGLVSAFVEEQAPFDMVINCVGFARPGYLMEQDMADIRAMMESNFFSAVNLTKAL